MSLLGGVKSKFAIWYATKWYRDGIAGKKGEAVKDLLSKASGARSAIVLLVLIAEGLAKAGGFETGPVFGIVYGLFSSLGWDVQSVKTTVGVDPVLLGTYAFGLYFAAKRIIAWAKTPSAPATK